MISIKLVKENKLDPVFLHVEVEDPIKDSLVSLDATENSNEYVKVSEMTHYVYRAAEEAFNKSEEVTTEKIANYIESKGLDKLADDIREMKWFK